MNATVNKPTTSSTTPPPATGAPTPAATPAKSAAAAPEKSPLMKTNEAVPGTEETSKVDSGGDKILKRYGNPASIEERKAAGDKVPEEKKETK